MTKYQEIIQEILSIPGKLNERDNKFYSVLFHCIDVGYMTCEIASSLPEKTFKLLQKILGNKSREETLDLIAFIASVHDIGKISPSFVKKICNKYPEKIKELEKLGFSFKDANPDTTSYHGIITTEFLSNNLTDFIASNDEYNDPGYAMSICTGGHHGIFPRCDDIRNIKLWDQGYEKWNDIRKSTLNILKNIFIGQDALLTEEIDGKILVVLSGIISVADWIVSEDDYWGNLIDDKFENHCFRSQIKASKYQELDIFKRPELKSFGWDDIMNNNPNPLQKTIIELSKEVNENEKSLLFIRCPTGTGKTAAFLYWVNNLIVKNNANGFYVAMPTQATGNSVYNSSRELLKKVNYNIATKAALIHGDVGYINKKISPWLGSSAKRALLCSIGVGTIDQVLLSTLKSKYIGVRNLGLIDKSVIFDEIHSYDDFVQSHLMNFIQIASLNNNSLCFSSATLSNKLISEITKKFFKKDIDLNSANGNEVIYITEKETKIIPVPISVSYHAKIDFIGRDKEKVIDTINEYTSDGGNTLLITNSVNDSIDYFNIAKEKFDGEIILWHSRMKSKFKKPIEKNINIKFGSQSDIQNRPKKCLVICTQVAEQSLDIDFDLLVTDLCPLEILLQRIGRNHRYLLCGKKRDVPDKLKCPTVLITSSLESDPTEDIHSVYYSYDLLKTAVILKEIVEKNNGIIDVINDTTYFTNLYCDFDKRDLDSQVWGERLSTLKKSKDASIEKKKGVAEAMQVTPDWYDCIFEGKSYSKEKIIADELFDKLEDESNEDMTVSVSDDLFTNPLSSEESFVKTRYTIPTVKISPCYVRNEKHYWDKKCTEPFNPSDIGINAINKISENTISIQKYSINENSEKLFIPEEWKKSHELKKNHFLPKVDHDDIIDIGNNRIAYDDTRGLYRIREENA